MVFTTAFKINQPINLIILAIDLFTNDQRE